MTSRDKRRIRSQRVMHQGRQSDCRSQSDYRCMRCCLRKQEANQMNAIDTTTDSLRCMEEMRHCMTMTCRPECLAEELCEAGIPEFRHCLEQSSETLKAEQDKVGRKHSASQVAWSNASLDHLLINGSNLDLCADEPLEIRRRRLAAYTTIMQIPL